VFVSLSSNLEFERWARHCGQLRVVAPAPEAEGEAEEEGAILMAADVVAEGWSPEGAHGEKCRRQAMALASSADAVWGVPCSPSLSHPRHRRPDLTDWIAVPDGRTSPKLGLRSLPCCLLADCRDHHRIHHLHVPRGRHCCARRLGACDRRSPHAQATVSDDAAACSVYTYIGAGRQVVGCTEAWGGER
jgi:hypothetical protein